MRTLTRWNPLREMTRFDPFGDLGYLWKEFPTPTLMTETEPMMRVEVTENDTGYLVKAEIPGVNKDDIEVSVDGNVVTLGFPEGQAFLRDVAERRRTILEEGVGRYLGRAVSVRCVATNLDLVEPVPDDGDRSVLLSEARRIFADDLVDVGEIG